MNQFRVIQKGRRFEAQRKYLFGWRNAFERPSEIPVDFSTAKEAEEKLNELGAFEDNTTKVVKVF